MFFLASKVLWFFAAPINVLLAIAFLGALLSLGRYGRAARAAAIVAVGLLLLAGLLPAGDWLIEPLEDRFPAAPADLAYAGGSNALTPSDYTEAADAAKLMVALGVDPARIELEKRSRNTDENARFTRDLVHPEPSQVWLLVTSAYHMPRSMGLFRKAGFNVVAYPVDYRSHGNAGDWRLNREPSRDLRLFDVAVHEWAGLLAYRLSGKTDALFPAP